MDSADREERKGEEEEEEEEEIRRRQLPRTVCPGSEARNANYKAAGAEYRDFLAVTARA